MKTIITIAGAALLALSSVTVAESRPHARPVTQGEPSNYDPDYNTRFRQDNSCFYSTGLPEMYACSSSGG